MTYLRLFWEFFKTGLFAVGGGMATVPFLQDIAAKTGWYTLSQLADMIAVSESTPGPLGVNMATYVGYTVGSGLGGVPAALLGALTATLGLVTPSVIVMLLVGAFLDKFRSNRWVENTLYGLRPASVAMITAAGVEIVLFSLLHVSSISGLLQAQISLKSVILFAVLLFCTNRVPQVKKLHPVWVILASAVVGIVLKME